MIRLIPLLLLSSVVVLTAQDLDNTESDASEQPCVSRFVASALESYPGSYEGVVYRLVDNRLYAGSYDDSCIAEIESFDLDVVHHEFFGRTLYLYDRSGSYRYDLLDRELSVANDVGRLSSFLSSPVTGLQVQNRYYSCTRSSTREFDRTIVSDYDGPSLLHQHDPIQVRSSVDPESEFSAKEITSLLRAFDRDPHRLPRLSDFDVTASEIAAYFDHVAEREEWESERQPKDSEESRAQQVSRDVHRTFVGMIETIEPETVCEALRYGRKSRIYFSGAASTVTLVNARNDTLQLSASKGGGYSFGIPWIVEYRGERSLCYDPDLARLLVRALLEDPDPEDLVRPGSRLLSTVAEYLADREVARIEISEEGRREPSED